LLKLTAHEAKILNELLTASPKAVAEKLGIEVQIVYNAHHRLRAKVQNAQEFLAATKFKYKTILKKRIKTPKIMPEDYEWSLDTNGS